VLTDNFLGKWTMPDSHACQFTLRLNARFVHVLSRVLKSELDRILSQTSSSVQGNSSTPGDPSNKRPEELSPVVESILPLLRIYSSWVVGKRDDIVRAEDTLEPYIKDMYRSLTKAMTSLCMAYQGQTLAIVKYLLPEDEEAMGLLTLDDNYLPPGCRLNYDDDLHQVKPAFGQCGGPRLDATGEMNGRVLNILQCGYFLANDDKFPFICQASGGNLTFSFVEDGLLPVKASAQDDAVPDSPAALSSTGPPANDEASVHSQVDSPQSSQFDALSPKTTISFGREQEDFMVENSVFHMLSDLLEPPEAQPKSATQTSSAPPRPLAPVAGNGGDEPQRVSSPPGGVSAQKPIPTLPWNYFYQTAPADGGFQSQGRGQGQGQGQGQTGLPVSPPFHRTASVGRPSTPTRSTHGIRFGEDRQDAPIYPSYRPITAYGAGYRNEINDGGSYLNYLRSDEAALRQDNTQSRATRSGWGNGLSEGYATTSAGSTQSTFGDWPSGGYSFSPWGTAQSTFGGGLSVEIRHGTAQLGATQSGNAQSTFGGGLSGGFRGSPELRPTNPDELSSFPLSDRTQQYQARVSGNVFANPSAFRDGPSGEFTVSPPMGPTNPEELSPFPLLETPRHQARVSGDLVTAPARHLAFSNQSSLYLSTPKHDSKGAGGPPAFGRFMTPENDTRAADAATAFGRGELTGADDPTKYRNSVKKTRLAPAANYAEDYNKEVFRSAVAGTPEPASKFS
jgi:hypothetical protein